MQSSSPKVYVIVLNYNGKNTVIDCINSIFQSDYGNFEVVVVDNNSTDQSLELIKSKFQKAHIIKNSVNLGFAAGNNVGIRFALEKFADYVFLLNNDATINKDTLTKMVKQCQLNNIAIANPVILKGKNGPLWFCGGKIKWLKMRSVHISNVPSNKNYITQYATGCAILIHKKVFKAIGLLDEKYFLYYEDVDFSYRANKKGFSSYVIPSVHVYHKEASEKSNSNKIYWLVLSGLIFFKKNTPLPLKPWIMFYSIIRYIKNKIDILLTKKQVKKQVQRAFRDFYKHPGKK